MRPTKKQVADLMFAELKSSFEKLGYKGRKTDCTFKKTLPDWEIEVIVNVEYPEWPTLYFCFNLVYFPVEKIMEEAFTWAKIYIPRTLSFDQTEFFKIKKEIEDFIVYADDYPSIVANSFFELYNERIVPILEALEDIHRLDQLVNNIPFESPNLISNHINHVYRGLIIRYLANPEDLDKLYEKYIDVVKNLYSEQGKKYAKAALKELHVLFEHLKNKDEIS